MTSEIIFATRITETDNNFHEINFNMKKDRLERRPFFCKVSTEY